MSNGRAIKYFNDIKFYLIAALSGLCFTSGFSGYDIPLPKIISSLSASFFWMFSIFAIITLSANFSNIFKLYKNNRTMFIVVVLLVAILALFNINWAIISLITLLAFSQNKYNLAAKYLFIWSLVYFVLIILLGALFPELGRESVGKSGFFFGSASGLSATSLGFANPNQPLFYLMLTAINGGFVFALSRYRIIYSIIMMTFATLIYFLTLSRTSYIAIMIFLLLYLLGSNSIYRLLRKSMVIAVVLFVAMSFFVAANFSQIGNPINDTLTNRPYYWNLRIEDGIISNILGNKDRYEDSGAMSALDNNYINLIARYGWVIFAIVFYLLIIDKKSINKKDDEAYVLGLFVILVYFLSESMSFSMMLCIIPTISIQRKFHIDQKENV